jgi:hypothetical protein
MKVDRHPRFRFLIEHDLPAQTILRLLAKEKPPHTL